MDQGTRDRVGATPLLWQRPRWAAPPALAAAWALWLVYGTLLPFDLDVAGWAAHHDSWLAAAVAWAAAPEWTTYHGRTSSFGLTDQASDLAANVALYAPLGVLAGLALRGRLRGRSFRHGPTPGAAVRPQARSADAQDAAGAIGALLPSRTAPQRRDSGARRRRAFVRVVEALLAAALVAGLSWVLECLQALSPTRYASLNDWLANAAAGAVGVVIAAPLLEAGRATLFWLHRRTARFTLPLVGLFRRLRRRPGMLLAAAMGGVVGVVAIDAVGFGNSLGRAGDGVWWLPFHSAFGLPYDLAAVQLMRSGVAWTAIAVLIALPLARRRPERALLRLAAGAAVLALAVETARATWWSRPWDVTEPVLAVTVAAALLTAAVLAVDAVRRSCRRRVARPVTIERRRRPHDYRFAR